MVVHGLAMLVSTPFSSAKAVRQGGIVLFVEGENIVVKLKPERDNFCFVELDIWVC